MGVIVAGTERGGIHQVQVSLDELSEGFFGFGGGVLGQKLFALRHVYLLEPAEGGKPTKILMGREPHGPLNKAPPRSFWKFLLARPLEGDKLVGHVMKSTKSKQLRIVGINFDHFHMGDL